MQCSGRAFAGSSSGWLIGVESLLLFYDFVVILPFGDQGLTEAEAGLSPDSDSFGSQHFSFTACKVRQKSRPY